MNAVLAKIVDIAIGHTRPAIAKDVAATRSNAAGSSRADRNFDVFISYRRDKGSEVARLLAEKLQSRGYRVFLDVDALGSGEWGKQLSDRIDECPDFIAIVTDGYFVRCENADDVVRREIAHALAGNSTVVPLLVGDARIPAELPADISGISAHNGVKYLHEYAEQAVDKVCSFLRSTPLLGPERLGTGEAQPRIIVLCVLFFIGVWRGAYVGEDLAYAMSAWWLPTIFGFGIGIVAVAVVVMPVMVALTAYGNRRSIRRDALYAGPWAPFWAILVPFMFLFASAFVFIVQKMVWGRSFFLGGILGGLSAIPITRLIVESNAWGLLSKALGMKTR